MIGQTKNKELLMNWRMNKSVPRFIIIEGDTGSGRLELAKIIIKIINATGVIAGTGIADIREIIENAYTVADTTCYIFRDCDDMSVSAKNSLLKVVEEPPNKAYFIMTVKNIGDMLGTIRSRATCVKMEPYTIEQLSNFTDDELVLTYSRTPQDTKIEADKIKNVSKFCDDLVNGLLCKSGSKTLKETVKLDSNSKDYLGVDNLYILRIFELKLINNLQCVNSKILTYITECKTQLKRSSVNGKASIESMLIKILEELKNGTEVS